MSFKFHKYHALGNDYLVVDPNHTKIRLDPGVIKLLCDRHYGVGSDGILFGPFIEDKVIRLKIFNPDGSEAEKSGNGIRIFSKYLFDAGYVKTRFFEITTLGGVVRVELMDEAANHIKVDMGTVTFQSDRIPVNGHIREVVNEKMMIDGEAFFVTCLSIGNPHCVIPVDEPSKGLALKLGPLVENSAAFPNRINMQLLKVIDRNTIRIEIWERGAGYTMASGSSSCAAASAAYKMGMVDSTIKVYMPGGVIDIEIKDGHVFMTGPVSGISKGTFLDDFARSINEIPKKA
jgi:diaminopimelate epimerase